MRTCLICQLAFLSFGKLFFLVFFLTWWGCAGSFNRDDIGYGCLREQKQILDLRLKTCWIRLHIASSRRGRWVSNFIKPKALLLSFTYSVRCPYTSLALLSQRLIFKDTTVGWQLNWDPEKEVWSPMLCWRSEVPTKLSKLLNLLSLLVHR